MTRVAVESEAGTVRVTVTDSGSGMTADHLAHVQEPFHSSKRDGTGLGLKIARRIVASHGGEMTIVSEAGVGTTVMVSLPAVT